MIFANRQAARAKARAQREAAEAAERERAAAERAEREKADAVAAAERRAQQEADRIEQQRLAKEREQQDEERRKREAEGAARRCRAPPRHQPRSSLGAGSRPARRKRCSSRHHCHRQGPDPGRFHQLLRKAMSNIAVIEQDIYGTKDSFMSCAG
ncbi:hypothetical protein [Xanthomonas oryzae]|uniref:hypothetical protein n=1 Tax=Xanthomonas oryzae TaxID=347 RepID=UPI00197F1110|nr:hypothetical protein [Xanthomonas oryzae]